MGKLERATELFKPTVGTQALLSALRDQSAIVRHVAVIRLASLSPKDLPEQSLRECLETLGRLQRREWPGVADEYSELTGYEDDFGQEIVVALARLSPGHADFAIPVLLEHWISDPSFYELAIALLALTFPVKPLLPPITDEQRRVLDALTANGPIWTYCAEFTQALEARALPSTREEIRGLLGNSDLDG
jgi:hypothetical protein